MARSQGDCFATRSRHRCSLIPPENPSETSNETRMRRTAAVERPLIGAPGGCGRATLPLCSCLPPCSAGPSALAATRTLRPRLSVEHGSEHERIPGGLGLLRKSGGGSEVGDAVFLSCGSNASPGSGPNAGYEWDQWVTCFLSLMSWAGSHLARRGGWGGLPLKKAPSGAWRMISP